MVSTIDQSRRQLREFLVELCDGLGEAADGEGSIDTAKPGHGCVRIILRDADFGGRFVVFAAAFL
jgi:hypothetical protein